MAASSQVNLFYDIAAIKQIPIISVAEQLGITVQKLGKNHWCKVRQEEHPSVVLHPERNSFYDFGNQIHGDVIRFVQYAKDIRPGEAIRYLGETFGLEPNMTRAQLLNRPLTNWEYQKIGLHGDMATKNFSFPIDTATSQELCELEQAYKMPLNRLQKEYPELYRKLIQSKAIPFVDNLRNCYYLDVWNHFHLVYALGDNSIRAYRSEEVRERFAKDTAHLNRCERVLYRAEKAAGINVPEPARHDPVNVIRDLLSGQLSIVLGNISLKDLSSLAERCECLTCEAEMKYDAYFDDRIQSIGHAAVYQAGKVTLQYLSLDEPEVMAVLQVPELQEERSITQQNGPRSI